ncbi:hypothetical protein GCM10022631_02880 [Deinococcus rubellus]
MIVYALWTLEHWGGIHVTAPDSLTNFIGRAKNQRPAGFKRRQRVWTFLVSLAQRFWVRAPWEGQAGEDQRTSTERPLDGPQAKLEVTQAALPVSINRPSSLPSDCLNTFRDKKERRQRENQDESV